MDERDVIDAEFEVIGEPTHEPFDWQGLYALITSLIIGAILIAAAFGFSYASRYLF